MPNNAATAAARLSCAPMMDWTDRHCRFFHRQLTRCTLLYTEMIVADAVLHGDCNHLLGYSPVEHPLALQIGGSDPVKLAQAAGIGEDHGYDEINLNVGCPSDRVRSGAFGACLMREPALVADCVAAMKAVVTVPVTVKCRLGVDEQDPGPALDALADAVVAAGCDGLWVHARKAWLSGLSPKENREVPPLDYERVYALKRRLPDVFIGINGGVETLEAAADHLERMDGVMLGRAAYQRPAILADIDRRFHDTAAPTSLEGVVEAMVAYVEAERRRGTRLHQVTRHMLGLFHGRPGARLWRRILSVRGGRPDADVMVLRDALAAVKAEQRRTAERPAAIVPDLVAV